MDEINLVTITFHEGTLVVNGLSQDLTQSLPFLLPDPRTKNFRCEAIYYRALIQGLVFLKIVFKDSAKLYQNQEWVTKDVRQPFPYQLEALESWWSKKSRGVVVLPTGTGKTFLAVLAIIRMQRPTLVVTPTIDLMNQWHTVLTASLGVPVGMMGGGTHEIHDVTVTTYDSAHIHLAKWGNKFGFLVFDECHHLPGSVYSNIALGSIAPFRLGLTATPERTDGNETMLEHLIGPFLSADEKIDYENARKLYRDYLVKRGISLRDPSGWQRFLAESSRFQEAKKAYDAFRLQKKIALHSKAKIDVLEKLLLKHANDPCIIFAGDNSMVYSISRRFLIPAVTHETKAKERKQTLDKFKSGEYLAVVTNKVLNEGVDVPSAGVGIVLSGSGTVREHVQRLGRILRKYKDKRAILYEVISRNTSEELTSKRRREHDAYRK
jgi:superfamily II DNA or RNA helicase